MKFSCLECDSTFMKFEDAFNHGIRMNHKLNFEKEEKK